MEDRREKRMLDAMLAHGNRNARIVCTVTLTREGGGELHQTFRAKAWDGRDGKMLTLDLMDGDWAAGVPNTKVAHVNLAKVETFPAKNDGRRYDDQLVLYAAKAAVRWLLDGETPRPANGEVAVAVSDFCACCGRELTDDTSIRLGIGPECEKKVYGTATKRSGTVAGRRRPAAPDVLRARDVQTTLGDEAAAIMDDHFALAAAVGDTPAQRRVGFSIMQNGVKVGWDETSADALETAEAFVGRGSTNVKVVDDATGKEVS